MKKPKIVHVLANGKKVHSIAGKVVPGENLVYEVILKSVNKVGVKTA